MLTLKERFSKRLESSTTDEKKKRLFSAIKAGNP
jgi:hypothetical protein